MIFIFVRHHAMVVPFVIRLCLKIPLVKARSDNGICKLVHLNVVQVNITISPQTIDDVFCEKKNVYYKSPKGLPLGKNIA